MKDLVKAAQELLEFIEDNNICDEADYYSEAGDDIVHFDKYRSEEFEDTINAIKESLSNYQPENELTTPAQELIRKCFTALTDNQ